uniref:UDP-glucuronosyltransferase n=1 Tax=Hucho hucho TaxID=62062 RepID=A0A4W5QLK1_9TELE
VTVLITLLVFCLPTVYGGKVLVFPVDGSHWINMKVIIEALHSRGHSVSVVRPSDSWYIKETSPHYSSISVDAPGGFDEDFATVFVGRLLEIQREGKGAWARFKLEMELSVKAGEMHEKICEMLTYIFENKELMKSLQDAKYDLVLTDPAMAGGVILAHYLSLPVVFNVRWTIHGEGHFAIAPSPLSYVPMVGAEVDFVFEFPRPTMPNVIYMAGFQCKPAKALPQDLEEFVHSSGEHGVIIMSLGTLVKIIWRHKGDRPATLGNNTLLVDWMPQNDLLGHPKTRLFVAHGGTNGVQEAIYHSVPIVGLPLIFDQPENLHKMKARGAAKILDIFTISRDVFLQALQEVLNEPSYRMNMQRLSRLHRDVPMEPLDTALFWIEFVMRHKGAAHLRTESYRMPWYSYHSVDVMVFLLAVCLCFRMCSRQKIKHE